jgi:hypothetical protein
MLEIKEKNKRKRKRKKWCGLLFSSSSRCPLIQHKPSFHHTHMFLYPNLFTAPVKAHSCRRFFRMQAKAVLRLRLRLSTTTGQSEARRRHQRFPLLPLASHLVPSPLGLYTPAGDPAFVPPTFGGPLMALGSDGYATAMCSRWAAGASCRCSTKVVMSLWESLFPQREALPVHLVLQHDEACA